MNCVEVKTQEEFDAAAKIGACIYVGAGYFTAHGSATVTAYDSATVRAYGSATVRAYGSATVTAYGSATVTAHGSATVTAHDSATVRAYGSATVTAYGSATVTAYGSATVTAHGSATVRAHDSATVRAYGSATVTAHDSATVRAHDSATVVLRGLAVLFLFSLGVRVLGCGPRCVIQRCLPFETLDEYLESESVQCVDKWVLVYKRVSEEWLTQERTERETCWKPGLTVTHENFQPQSGEFGAGKFHACSLPIYCDEFRSEPTDRYVAIRVKRRDLAFWPRGNYRHKIGFRKGEVLFECDRDGRMLEPKAA